MSNRGEVCLANGTQGKTRGWRDVCFSEVGKEKKNSCLLSKEQEKGCCVAGNERARTWGRGEKSYTSVERKGRPDYAEGSGGRRAKGIRGRGGRSSKARSGGEKIGVGGVEGRSRKL